MTFAQAAEHFEPASLTHYVILLALVLTCYGVMIGGREALERGPAEQRRFERWFAACLITIWTVANLTDAIDSRFSWSRAFPFHVCDMVGLAAAVGMQTWNRESRAIVYFWGFGLSSQAVVTPTLLEGFSHFQFWHFWIFHFGIVAAGVYELTVRRYRPGWQCWRRAVICSAGYLLLVLPVNVRLGVNYGFVGHTNAGQPAIIRVLGPWPGRVPIIFLGVTAMTAAMALPWTLLGRRQLHWQSVKPA